MHEKRFNLEIERLRDPGRIARLEVERVVKLSLQNLDNVQTVLDIGTGSGLFAEQFAAKGLLVTGLDSRAEMLPVAQHYVPSGVFREGTAEKLPFPDASFDLVFMGLLLHETDNPLEALKKKLTGWFANVWPFSNGNMTSNRLVRHWSTGFRLIKSIC